MGLRPEVRWNEYDFERGFKGIGFGDVAGMGDMEGEKGAGRRVCSDRD